MKDTPFEVGFYRSSAGNEPVQEWLRSLPKCDKLEIGSDIKAVQWGWPIGLPLVGNLSGGFWEVRTNLKGRIARILFTFKDDRMVLLHGFIKKTQKISKGAIELAKENNKIKTS